MAILLSQNIAQCDDRARPRGATTARRDDRAAVGWAWTGRNLILDEALFGRISMSRPYSVQSAQACPVIQINKLCVWSLFSDIMYTKP